MSSTRGTGQPGPKRWPGISARILATLFFLSLVVALNRCSLPNLIQDPPTTVPPVQVTPAVLAVDVLPQGANVTVDGLRSGTTPVSLELSPGRHKVRIDLEGYEPQELTIDLGHDGTTVDGQLVPLETDPTATSTPTPVPEQVDQHLPDLKIAYARVELETGGRCDYTSTQLGVRVGIENVGKADAGPFVVEVNGVQQGIETGLEAGQKTSLWFEGYGGQNTIIIDPTSQVQENDKDNNFVSEMLPIPTLPAPCTRPPTDPPTSTPTPPVPPTETPSAPPPTSTPTPPVQPPAAAVTVQEGQVSIPTYPYADYLTQEWNEAFNMPYQVLDRSAYEASNPTPVDKAYRTLEVENDYLKLTILPELGGRIYEVFFKPTGHHETYRNPVFKPSPWGPPEQGWWLAAGGIEWCLPVIEHGYEWGIPWTAQVSKDDNGVTVLLRDTTATDRVRTEIAVRLESGTSSFSVRPRLENPTSAPLTMSYWTNAALAPGGQNSPSAGLRFILPHTVTNVTVHSRGDDELPAYNQRMPWPIHNGTDISRLGNWNRWLGFFEDPAAGAFIAVYDEGYDEGMVRVFDPQTTMGAKVFALGWNDPIPASNWTDDGSSFVEIHGGPAPTFDDSITIPAGEHVQWTETWYPVAGLGGMGYANSLAALNLVATAGNAEVAVATAQPWSGDVVLLLNDQEHWRQAISLVPGQAFSEAIALDSGNSDSGWLTLHLEQPDGSIVAEYRVEEFMH